MHHNLYVEYFWQGSGPLFFYIGNAVLIEEFYENSGFIYELAQDFNALIVFGEHVSFQSACIHGVLCFKITALLHVYITIESRQFNCNIYSGTSE